MLDKNQIVLVVVLLLLFIMFYEIKNTNDAFRAFDPPLHPLPPLREFESFKTDYAIPSKQLVSF